MCVQVALVSFLATTILLFSSVGFENAFGDTSGGNDPSPAEYSKPLGERAEQQLSGSTIPGEVQKNETAPSDTLKDSGLTHYPSDPVAVRAVDRNISLFAERIRERFSLWLSRSGKYVELMKDILKANNIPEDIVFLSLIESGFNPQAYSVARAVGPWQFIASTGKRYGLTIDWWRDERKDPVKSTEAAANYLGDLYEMFGSWNLAMAAYNAGEGKILKALNRSRSDDYWDLLSTKHIRSETKEYVPRFIAAKMIADDPKSYGFSDVEYHPPLQFDEVTLDSPIDLEVAARCAGTTVEVIRELNPELRRWCTPVNASSYVLRVPEGQKESFAENLSMIPREEQLSVTTYTVKKSDTLKKIADRTGVPTAVIVELNDDVRSLKAGEMILLPPTGKVILDRDDKIQIKKASYTKKKTGKKKTSKKRILVTSLNKKQAVVND